MQRTTRDAIDCSQNCNYADRLSAVINGGGQVDDPLQRVPHVRPVASSRNRGEPFVEVTLLGHRAPIPSLHLRQQRA